eukprot:scaffold178334_cov31-Tisochrysis_lutea.AAC.2
MTDQRLLKKTLAPANAVPVVASTHALVKGANDNVSSLTQCATSAHAEISHVLNDLSATLLPS